MTTVPALAKHSKKPNMQYTKMQRMHNVPSLILFVFSYLYFYNEKLIPKVNVRGAGDKDSGSQ